MEHLVLIGAGQSAIQCITSLKKEGYSGSITLVGEEEHLPYQRPPLSKGFLEKDLFSIILGSKVWTFTL